MKVLTNLSESVEPLLPIALVLARGYVMFVALAGLLFGQMFFGIFSLADTVAGISAIFAASLGGLHASNNAIRGRVVLFCCLAALGGTAASAIHYYRELDIPGNDFGWELRGPFVLSLLLIGTTALKKPSTPASS